MCGCPPSKVSDRSSYNSMPPPCSPSLVDNCLKTLSINFAPGGQEFCGFSRRCSRFSDFLDQHGFSTRARGPRQGRKDSGDQCVRAARRGKERERERVRVRVIKGIGSGAWWSRLVRPERAAEASVRRRGEIGGPASLGLARSRCDGPPPKHADLRVDTFGTPFCI